jgi:protein ImuA
VAELDDWLGGGLARGGLHEVFAAGQADMATAAGFAALLALQAARRRRVLWVRQDFLDGQAGQLHPPGLAALGLNPALVVLVRASDVPGALRAAGEAARCNGLGVVLMELWGEAPPLDHRASRRLSLAAEESGVPVLMLRVAATPAASAAASRWLVGALPSRPLAANAPGPPAFAATLLRHRGGAAGATWHLEWNHERQCFQAHDATPLPRAVVPVSAGRAIGPDREGGWRRAG